MSISAMKQALEALDAYSWEQVDAARSALRQAIAEAEKQQQIAEDFIKYGASWSKDGKRIDPSEIYAPTQAPVHAIDISQERVDETAKHRHEWVELSRDEVLDIEETTTHPLAFYRAISDKLKERNT
jgi:hypothetical protein